MEKLQGPINPCLISEDLEVGNWLEEFISTTATNLKFEDPYNNNNNNDEVVLSEAYYYNNNNNYNCNNNNNNINNNHNVGPLPQYTLPSLEDKMPFLQMLQTIEPSQLQQQHQQLMEFEPNIQLLLRLEHQKIMDLHSQGVKCEYDNVRKFAAEEVEPKKCNGRSKRHNSSSNNNNNDNDNKLKCSSSSSSQKEKKKKKRKRSVTRPVKNKEEVETQRMTHIAVERNRRRQMNLHLTALRSLMPPSYVQRGDQASIIGGAIDFVKELEQMLQSLQAQKKLRQWDENGDVSGNLNSSTSSTSNVYTSNVFMDSPLFHKLRNQVHTLEDGNRNEDGNLEESTTIKSSNDQEHSAEKRSALADIEVVVIQNHVNLKIQCQRRPGQLLKAIVAFEELRLTVLHLNITSMHTLVHYSFNLKIEDDCNLGSADEVARAVHQIFSFINLSC